MKFKRVYLINKKNILYNRYEFVNFKIKILICSLFNKNILFLFLNKFLSDSLSLKTTIIKNYCLDSGRSRGLQKQFWLSRIKLREFIAKRLICGFKKASW